MSNRLSIAARLSNAQNADLAKPGPPYVRVTIRRRALKAAEENLLDKPGVRQIAADRVSRLPWLAPPAGYIVLIQDVAYGNRCKIARHQQLDRYQIKRGADFPFQTRVVLILEAENAAQAERDLHDELAAEAAIGDWFDLAEFPKSPPAQTLAPAPTRPQELVSLRDLVENDEGADSLLKEADIVAANRHVSRPRRPARPETSSARRRRPRAARWAFALGLLVLVGLIAAEGPSDIWNAIESMLNARTQQSNTPTPAVEGRGEVFFMSARAPLRTCAAPDCRAVEMLDPGFRITARKFVKGQRVNGSTRWIATLHQGELRYIHDSVLSRTWPLVEPTTTRSRSASPTPQIVGRDEVFYSKTRSRVRTCANMSCRTAAFLNAGTKITARRYVSGQQVNGSARWIAFLHEGELHYIHDSVLSRSWPPVEPTPQPSPSEKPTRIQATAVGQGEVFYLRSKANARHCARLSCEILDVLPPGTKITALRFVAGETIDGSDLWIRFSYNRQHLSIHSSWLTRTDPNERPTRIQATAVGQGEVFYVRSKANARHCARLSCEILDVLPPGTKITALRFVAGETIDGSARWIAFTHEGELHYIHDSVLARNWPPVEPTPQPSPTATFTATEPPPTATFTATEPPPTPTSTSTQPPAPTATVAIAPKYVVETAGGVNANIRACPRTNCEIVANFAPGTEIVVVGRVEGETVYQTDVWLEIRLDGGSAYIHSELAVGQ